MTTSQLKDQPTRRLSEVLLEISEGHKEFHAALLDAILDGTLDGFLLDTKIGIGKAEVQDVVFFETPAYAAWRREQDTVLEFRKRGMDRKATVTELELSAGQVDLEAKVAGLRELLWARKKRQVKAGTQGPDTQKPDVQKPDAQKSDAPNPEHSAPAPAPRAAQAPAAAPKQARPKASPAAPEAPKKVVALGYKKVAFSPKGSPKQQKPKLNTGRKEEQKVMVAIEYKKVSRGKGRKL